MTNRFIQIHSLVGYPGVLLNRDSNGSAKRLSFGGSSRIRVSSQSLKRHWRTVDDDWAVSRVGAPTSVRSREIVDSMIQPQLVSHGSPEVVAIVAAALNAHLYGEKGKEKKSRQALLVGKPEIRFLTDVAIEVIEANKNDVEGAKAAIDAAVKAKKITLSAIAKQIGDIPAGIEAALFGRMVTSDVEANSDAAIHVAHAFSVHPEEAESDYFTVVDDLETGHGSGGIFDTEITSSLFYGYVVVDVGSLIDNLGGDAELAGRVVKHLVHLIATVTPGAKKGSTAPYSYAETILIEAGNRQPRTLANAFRDGVKLKHNDLGDRAMDALSTHLGRLDGAYGVQEKRHLLSVSGKTLPGVDGEPMTLDAIATAAADAVMEGR